MKKKALIIPLIFYHIKIVILDYKMEKSTIRPILHFIFIFLSDEISLISKHQNINRLPEITKSHLSHSFTQSRHHTVMIKKKYNLA